ncbi:hypothetical protein [Listeria booriae]|uniref:hypothetical protein n=1 Tax=Listeria booriae TaxID=1552123 RepID=UPI00162458E1|nr:hypothetical protein [Listeria booriae]MBC1308043.1 hypothetical protein [Listeria booriae]MBC2194267.1 hypothetical protein [Listeria booriae]MBC2370340.1 hypothetical protein [Listeria booriae]
MLNSQIENIINMYYQGENEELYVAKSAERLELPVEIVAFCATHNVELKIMTNYENPSEKWYFTMGEYKEGNFEVEYTTILSVSKLANVYALEHSFEVLNKDPNKIEPVLVGDAEAAYNVGQFDLEELVKQCYEAMNFTRMFWVEALRTVENIHFAEGITLFGPYVTQEDILFRDVLDILPD